MQINCCIYGNALFITALFHNLLRLIHRNVFRNRDTQLASKIFNSDFKIFNSRRLADLAGRNVQFYINSNNFPIRNGKQIFDYYGLFR